MVDVECFYKCQMSMRNRRGIHLNHFYATPTKSCTRETERVDDEASKEIEALKHLA